MWSRKRIDIAWNDLASGAIAAIIRKDVLAGHQAVAAAWPSERAVFACLSVRSGWDLLLAELALPTGSEVLMSAMTIPDMAEIVRAHGLVPVPLELEARTAAPSPETLRQAITPKSKLVLIAHLFGTRIDLTPHLAVAHECGLMFLEDCAQAYAGPTFPGHEEADVSMFSFGTIKTCTALGSGLFHLRDRQFRDALTQRQATYPLQPRGKYLNRLLKYSGLKLLSTYPVFSLFVRGCRLSGINYNEMLNSSVRGFAGTAGVERFRWQPSAPLLRMLARRIRRHRPKRIQRQQQLGQELLSRIQPLTICPGGDAGYHHFWVFPVLTDQPRELIAALQQAGFDATQGESLRIIEKPKDSPALEPTVARDLLSRMVYVPMYPELTYRAVDRLAAVLTRFFEQHPVTQITEFDTALDQDNPAGELSLPQSRR